MIGVVSFGNPNGACMLNQPSVLTRVSNYLDWIELYKDQGPPSSGSCSLDRKIIILIAVGSVFGGILLITLITFITYKILKNPE